MSHNRYWRLILVRYFDLKIALQAPIKHGLVRLNEYSAGVFVITKHGI